MAAVAALAGAVSTGSTSSAQAARQPWVTGFYVGYMSKAYPPSAIDFSSLTHIVVFAALPRADGTLDTKLFIDGDGGAALARDIAGRAHAAGRKALLAIGGAGSADAFAAATSPANLNAFAARITETIAAWNLDGVDLDWEPLGSPDRARILLLVERLRAARPAIIITADAPWQNSNFALNAMDGSFYARLAVVVDQMNMMTYGMADNWGTGWKVWHSSALTGEGPDHPTSVHSSVRSYLAAGVPAAKLGIGVGFYGSCWASPVNEPLQIAGGSRVVAGDNAMSYATIIASYRALGRYRFDAAARVPYLTFTQATGSEKCTFISYEDEVSVAEKGKYAASMGLGGTIVWQLNEGYTPGLPDPDRLLHAVARAFGLAPAR